jgi:hypothetical protein
MAGFKFRKSVRGDSGEAAELTLLAAASIVLSIGDLIRINNAGTASLVTGGDLVLGVVTGVTDKNGLPLTPDAGTLDTYTMASDNVTNVDKNYLVRYIPALADYLFENIADSALSRTLLFTFMAVNDENDVDPGATSDTTVNTVRLIELDPDNTGSTTKGLFQIVESFWAQNAMGTVDTGGIEAA